MTWEKEIEGWGEAFARIELVCFPLDRLQLAAGMPCGWMVVFPPLSPGPPIGREPRCPRGQLVLL